MPGLFGSLINTAATLQVFDRALTVMQNNVSNSSTPGYAKQILALESMPFQIETGLAGGVASGGLVSARSEYAEQAVRSQQQAYGRFDQQAADLVQIEPIFDVTGSSGIPDAISRLFQSFSSWSMAPNDTVARSAVLDSAGEVSRRFGETATSLMQASGTVDQEFRSMTESINVIAGRLRDLNVDRRQDFRAASDPGLDANIHTNLEQLAELVDFTTIQQADGSLTVLLGGQTPLVIGDRQFDVQADLSSASGQVVLRDANGQDITDHVSGGRLSAVIGMKNTTLPAYLDSLNQLAAGLADSVNTALQNGLDKNGNPGAALFTYNLASDAAFTLRAAAISPDELAAALPDAPGGNGNALNLVDLANSPQVDGATFTGFYGALARQMGNDLQTAQQNRQTQQDLLLQAKTVRDDISGVSLDEEASRLMQFQRAYQATSHMLSVLNDLTGTVIDLLR